MKKLLFSTIVILLALGFSACENSTQPISSAEKLPGTQWVYFMNGELVGYFNIGSDGFFYYYEWESMNDEHNGGPKYENHYLTYDKKNGFMNQVLHTTHYEIMDIQPDDDYYDYGRQMIYLDLYGWGFRILSLKNNEMVCYTPLYDTHMTCYYLKGIKVQ